MRRLLLPILGALLVTACAPRTHDAVVVAGTGAGAVGGVALCNGDTLVKIACGLAGAGVGALGGEVVAHGFDFHHQNKSRPIQAVYILQTADVNYYVHPKPVRDSLTHKEWHYWESLVNQKCHTIQFVMPTTAMLSLGQACPTKEGVYKIINSMPRENQ